MRLATRKGFIVCLLYTRIFCFLLQMLTSCLDIIFIFYKLIKGLRWLAIKDSQMYINIKVKVLRHVQLFGTPWTVACQAPLSMGFSRQEYWSGSPIPSPGGLPNPGIKPGSPALQADSLPSEPLGKPICCVCVCVCVCVCMYNKAVRGTLFE